MRGWIGGRTWLNSATMLERGNWCNDLCLGNPALGMQAFDVLAWATRNQIPSAQAAATLIELLLQGNLDQFRRRVGIADLSLAREQRAALDQIGTKDRPAAGSLLEFMQSTSAITFSSSARPEGVGRANDSGASYPEFYGLARRLKLIAQLIKAGLQTCIYYTQIGGFDTHANQLQTHASLLREVGDSLKAFLDDLSREGEASRVLVLVFSEFGRRLRESASGGTEHCTAAPVFLIDPGVNPGLHGPHPNLRDLTDGDPRHAVDFRQIYATLLDQWLQRPSQQVLGQPFAQLPLIRV